MGDKTSRFGKVKFHVGMVTLVILLMLVLLGAVMFNTYREGDNAARQTAYEVFAVATERMLEKVNLVFDRSTLITRAASQLPSIVEPITEFGPEHQSLNILIPILQHQKWISSVYFSHKNGNFLKVISVGGNKDLQERYQTPEDTAFIVRTIHKSYDGLRYERFHYLDADAALIDETDGQVTDYDPREQNWYEAAWGSKEVVVTDPYYFDGKSNLGITTTFQIRKYAGVLGIDTSFSSLKGFFSEHKFSENGTLVFFDKTNRLLAYSSKTISDEDLISPHEDLGSSANELLYTIADLRALNELGKQISKDIEGEPYFFRVEGLSGLLKDRFYVAAIGPYSDFTKHVNRMVNRVAMVSAIIFFIIVPAIFLLIRRLSTNLENLSRETVAIQNMDFSESPPTRSLIREVDQLGSAFTLMKETICKRTTDLETTQDKLKMLVDRSLSVSEEADRDRLYDLFLDSARELAHAAGAVLILKDSEKFFFEKATIGDVSYDASSPLGQSLEPIFDDQNALSESFGGVWTPLLIWQVENQNPVFKIIENVNEHSQSVARFGLVVPLQFKEDEPIGALILMRMAGHENDLFEFEPDVYGFILSLSAQVANMEAVRRHEAYLEDMVVKRTEELGEALNVINSSISYSSRIQRSLMDDSSIMSTFCRDHFILWEPRDTVGGDIYWTRYWGEGVLIILGDCTGHGVPGALMTMIVTGALDRAQMDVTPGDIPALLQRLHQFVQLTLRQNRKTGESDDGMELGICYIPTNGDHIQFCGARFELFEIVDDDVTIIKGTKKGIGYRKISFDQTYELHKIPYREGQSFYMTSDGFIDQVGGQRRRMYGKKRFSNALLSMQDKPMSLQKDLLIEELKTYQGTEKRRDDISVIGFKL